MADIPLTLRLVKGSRLTWLEADTNFTNLRDAIQNNVDVDIYTNLNPTPETVGGIPAGSTFNDMTIQAVLDELLYPYQNPGFSSFGISGQSSPLEVGATSNANPSFTWSLSNSGNVTANSINISDTTASTTLVTGHSTISPAAVTHVGITKTSSASETYHISGTNTQSGTFGANYSINWLWKVYYGETATTPLTASDIQGLRVGNLQSGFSGVYNFAASPSQYKYICYPASMGLATSFTDQATNLDVPFNAVYTVSVTNSHGVTTNYNVHRTVYMIGSSLPVVVS